MKIKHNGVTLEVRVLGDDEIIPQKALVSDNLYSEYSEDDIKRMRFRLTSAAGEPVRWHPNRVYLEVLSKFW